MLKKLFDTWEGSSPELMLKLVKEALFDSRNADSPSVKNGFGDLLYVFFTEKNIPFEKLELKFNGDEFSKEDQHWFYRDVIDNISKAVKNRGGTESAELKAVAETLTAAAKAYKDG